MVAANKKGMKSMKKAGGAMKKAQVIQGKKAKVMKSMKVAVKKVMKRKFSDGRAAGVSKGIYGKSNVWRETSRFTGGHLQKSDLKKNKKGKVVQKSRSDRVKKSKTGKIIATWAEATKAARIALGITGFCPVGGKTPNGKKLLKKVRSILAKK